MTRAATQKSRTQKNRSHAARGGAAGLPLGRAVSAHAEATPGGATRRARERGSTAADWRTAAASGRARVADADEAATLRAALRVDPEYPSALKNLRILDAELRQGCNAACAERVAAQADSGVRLLSSRWPAVPTSWYEAPGDMMM